MRLIDGKAPELFISNLRGSGSGKAEEAGAFLAKELATRNFHPGYIQSLMKEGYAGTLQMVDSMNNFTGWTTVAREIVRDDQWQEFADVYVRDKHQLGMRQWIERENPHAMAQMVERMLEMARQGYWQADAAMVSELKARYKDLAQRFDVRSDNRSFQEYVGLPGYGLSQAVAPSEATAQAHAQRTKAQPQPAPTVPPAQPQTAAPLIEGLQLEKVTAPVVQALGAMLMLALGLLLLTPAVGAWRQWRRA